jgi:hypothetical protein
MDAHKFYLRFILDQAISYICKNCRHNLQIMDLVDKLIDLKKDLI